MNTRVVGLPDATLVVFDVLVTVGVGQLARSQPRLTAVEEEGDFGEQRDQRVTGLAVAGPAPRAETSSLQRQWPRHGSGLTEDEGVCRTASEYPVSMSESTAKLTLELPVEVFSALRRSPEEFGQQMRVAAAIHWYSRNEVSMEKAALIAGMNRRDFLLELGARKTDVFEVDVDELRRELDA